MDTVASVKSNYSAIGAGLTILLHRHHMFLLTFNDKLFLAPLEDPKKVLDVGTGNGIWPQYDHV